MNFEETYQWYDYLMSTNRWAAEYALRELRCTADKEFREKYQLEFTQNVMDLIADLSDAEELHVRPRERYILYKLYGLGLGDSCIYTLLTRYKSKRLTQRKAHMILTKYGNFDVEERMYGGF